LRSAHKVMGLQNHGSPKTKSYLDVGPMGSHKIYYKGEGGGFSQVWAVVNLVNLVSPSCMWLVFAPKVLQQYTNHLVLLLRMHVWVSEACQFFLVSSRSSNTPFYPSKVLWIKECDEDSLFFCCLLFRVHIWIPQRVRSTSQQFIQGFIFKH
jgi:hypothetical protein